LNVIQELVGVKYGEAIITLDYLFRRCYLLYWL
jgi:hypothetical protein